VGDIIPELKFSEPCCLVKSGQVHLGVGRRDQFVENSLLGAHSFLDGCGQFGLLDEEPELDVGVLGGAGEVR
jgi:hypothetical protein